MSESAAGRRRYSRHRQFVKVTIRLLVAGVCVCFLLGHARPAGIGELLKTISIPLVGLAAVCACIWVVSGWLSLFVLLGMSHATRASLAGYSWIQAFSGFTPGRAGDLLIPVALKTDGLESVRLLAVTVVQRITNLWVILFSAAIAFFVNLRDWRSLLVVAAVCIGGCCVAPMVAIVSKALPRRWKGLHDAGQRLQLAIRATRRSVAVSHVLLVMLRFAANCAVGYVTIRALNVAVPVSSYLEAFTLAAFVTLVPVSLSGIGISEAVMWKMLAGYGCTVEVILAGGLVSRGLLVVVPLVISGVVWGLGRAKSTGAVTRSDCGALESSSLSADENAERVTVKCSPKPACDSASSTHK